MPLKNYACANETEMRRLATYLACQLPIECGYWACLFVLGLVRHDLAWTFDGIERPAIEMCPADCLWRRAAASIGAHLPDDRAQSLRIVDLVEGRLAWMFDEVQPAAPSSSGSFIRSSASSNLRLAWTNPRRSPR
jgi:hypothetical protein